MADFYLFGVPHGFDTSQCDANIADFLGLFYAPHKPGTEMKIIRRPNNDVHYIFLVYENADHAFTDINGRDGSFFGMTLVFHNQYVTDTEKLKKLFQKTYDNYVKGKIINEFPNGNKRWMIRSLKNSNDKIATDVANGMNKLIKNYQEFNFSRDIQPLPPMQNQIQR